MDDCAEQINRKLDELARVSRARGRLEERAALADIVAQLSKAALLLREAERMRDISGWVDRGVAYAECADTLDRLRDEYHANCLKINLCNLGV